MKKHYIIHTDGGSRGNPGNAAVGVVIDDQNPDGKIIRIESHGERIGIATNNVAEYSAVTIALKHLIALSSTVNADETLYEFYLDSLLVVQQLNGVYKVKDLILRKFVLVIRELEKDLGGTIRYTAVRREKNVDADLQVNAALDARA